MPVTFSALWNAYPADRNPCRNANGDPSFDNQCAIRLSVCLADGGVNLSSCRAVRCWHGHGRRHVIRAQQLADWLASPLGKRAVNAIVMRRSKVDSTHYSGISGIVFFRNFWGAGNQGDHIDLWNGKQLQTGELEYFSRSQQVWFWEIL